MKTVLISILCCFSLLLTGESYAERSNYVECYYNKDVKKPLLIYDDINGKVVDSLYNINDKNAWYKLTILNSDYGWFKIKNISRLPSSKKQYNYENYWVKNVNFLIDVDNYDETHQVYIYDLPSLNSNKIHRLDNFQKVNVIEVDGLWAKVKFGVGKKQVTGWLGYKDQCGLPWTTCPK
ncbi:SH3 domain-containing protein [uncultured Psychroserpens sp.]|uniref:SH3 domain-containing protein n=1 Tax=uncultured Psychroserpens sp. TaxID=255436 RepID=UPI002619DAB9|nr:SH3 domain-containing protein [uncultured Psychroserpens sp.]